MKTSHLQSMQARNAIQITRDHNMITGSKFLIKDLGHTTADELSTRDMLFRMIGRAQKRIKKLSIVQIAIKQELRGR